VVKENEDTIKTVAQRIEALSDVITKNRLEGVSALDQAGRELSGFVT
jgi:hypothetical protein